MGGFSHRSSAPVPGQAWSRRRAAVVTYFGTSLASGAEEPAAISLMLADYWEINLGRYLYMGRVPILLIK
jgi:hypothetical protein